MTENQKPERELDESTVEAVLHASLPPVTTTEAKAPARSTTNFIASRRVLPDLIDTAISRGVRIILTKVGYELEGFYKAGPMRLEPHPEHGGLVAIDRKEMLVPIKVFDDLVRLNYECWKKSRDKGAAYINPGREWVEEFARLNLVKRQVIFVPGED